MTTRPIPFETTATTGLFSFSDALGISNPNAFVDALERSASSPLQALESLTVAQQNIDALRDHLISEMRSPGNRWRYPWAAIAAALGTSSQNAHRKFRRLEVG